MGYQAPVLICLAVSWGPPSLQKQQEQKANSHSCFLLPFSPTQLVASIVFISFGVIAAFCCAIVDGVFAARHIVSILNLGFKENVQ